MRIHCLYMAYGWFWFQIPVLQFCKRGNVTSTLGYRNSCQAMWEEKSSWNIKLSSRHTSRVPTVVVPSSLFELQQCQDWFQVDKRLAITLTHHVFTMLLMLRSRMKKGSTSKWMLGENKTVPTGCIIHRVLLKWLVIFDRWEHHP